MRTVVTSYCEYETKVEAKNGRRKVVNFFENNSIVRSFFRYLFDIILFMILDCFRKLCILMFISQSGREYVLWFMDDDDSRFWFV